MSGQPPARTKPPLPMDPGLLEAENCTSKAIDDNEQGKQPVSSTCDPEIAPRRSKRQRAAAANAPATGTSPRSQARPAPQAKEQGGMLAAEPQKGRR
eukprot:CAMPEP_0206364416 /NCGR_PEP_ID=MMETSP0294-20121207/2203_1 /ASSEMBLY_ACC=CAM_ASM_000327 /TAXON_ID=39354 /ORGANISM="Heterosigma akashiwo, Strain CCMP2393" /LENGTH=96 /DNA_ID=CAMNT_0053810005 /DNA_START=57 /DNA_END=343 /DNA_ORIENTATION=-